MFKNTFVGRSRELETLNRLWRSPRATLLILYGRRRVGKTRLLTHWLQDKPHVGFYWVAEPSSAYTQLLSFSQALMAFIDPDADVPPDFSFATWELAFRQLARHSQQQKAAVIIDEVTYLIDANPEFNGILQKVWDSFLSESGVMLALSGSQMGMMQQHLLNYDAPLYGRATAQISLPALPYGATREYFPTFSAEERLRTYAIWGGIPAYWERLDQEETLLNNLRNNILPSHAWMIDESRILLQDFITDLHNYVGILRAVADEQQALGEIAKRTGLTSSKASFYLSVLRDTGFVARRVPVSQYNKESRRGRYVVADPYLRFFYRFLSAYQSQLALGQVKPVIKSIETHIDRFISANSWQDLCREWVLYAGANDVLPFNVEHIGSEWTRSTAIDVVGLNVTNHEAVLGDCYWENVSVSRIDELAQNATALLPKSAQPWSAYFILFTTNEWSADEQRQAESLVAQRALRTTRWEVKGVRLVSLAQLDRDLVEWSV